MYHVGEYTDKECTENCRNFTPIEVTTVQGKNQLIYWVYLLYFMIIANEEEDEFPCAGYDEQDCRYVFVYKKYNLTHYIVQAQKERECPAKV